MRKDDRCIHGSTVWLFFLYNLWLAARAQACIWWTTKQWKSKEVESLTDSKSSSPFWQECRGKRGKKSRERDVRWKQCQLRAECIDYSENESHPLVSLAVRAGPRDTCKRTKAGADRPSPKRGGKTCVSVYRICLGVTLQGLDHKVSCHSKFGNQFSQSETSWRLKQRNPG